MSVSTSEIGGLAWMELWTLSHSNELADDTRDQSDSLLWATAEFCVLVLLGQ